MWYNTSVFYQIYPLGFCGAPRENDGILAPRIQKVSAWANYLVSLGVGAVYFSPVFSSDRHGYDTRNYGEIDCRLGTNADFAAVCDDLHAHGIRVVLDGVFNHVGRGFWAFQDVLANREQSPYRDWFYIDFGRDNGYGDGLWYEGWEGHFELVKLNLRNPAVVEHLFYNIREWVNQFGIDGLRLDVAYCLDRDFLRRLRTFCDALKPEFLLLGEALFGDYNQLVNHEMLHSCTNYECYKGIYSSLNELNFFEISYSLNRQFGPENWALYQEKHLLSFIDNHDVSRIASILKEKRHLPLAFALLFGMPGIPCLYYGSEWGAQGEKQAGDDALRPCFDAPEPNECTDWVKALSHMRPQSRALCEGGYRNVHVTNRQLVFERAVPGERVLAALNAEGAPYTAPIGAGDALDLLSGETVNLSAGLALGPYEARFLRVSE